jgi:hypothetical protein
LQLERQLADLVEEQCSSVRALHQSRNCRGRTGMPPPRPNNPVEQAAAHALQSNTTNGPLARVIAGAARRRSVLSRPGPPDQHRRVGRRDSLELSEQAAHRGAPPISASNWSNCDSRNR